MAQVWDDIHNVRDAESIYGRAGARPSTRRSRVFFASFCGCREGNPPSAPRPRYYFYINAIPNGGRPSEKFFFFAKTRFRTASVAGAMTTVTDAGFFMATLQFSMSPSVKDTYCSVIFQKKACFSPFYAVTSSIVRTGTIFVRRFRL